MLLIEVKASDETSSSKMYFFMNKLKLEKSIQLVYNYTGSKTKNGLSVVNLEEWLSQDLNTKIGEITKRVSQNELTSAFSFIKIKPNLLYVFKKIRVFDVMKQ